MRKFGILFGASLLALCTSPAVAGPFGSFDGVLSGDYANTNLSSGLGSAHANDWGFDGAGAFNLGWSNLSAQVEGGWHDFNLDHLHGDVNNWNGGGALYWTGHGARVGATAGYQSVDGGGTSVHAINYGGFGDLYAGPIFTLGVKGGGFTGNDGLGGGNVGVQGILYLRREIALSANYDYYSLNHSSIGLSGTENAWGGKLEWLISPRLPVSIWGSYDHASIGGLGHANTWMAGLKFYTDSFGPAPLVERQRGGAEQWGTTFTPAGFVY